MGTNNILVYIEPRGIIINEPSAVAINKKTDTVIAVGAKAQEMVGKTPPYIEVVRPMRNGVIADAAVTEHMVKHFLKKAVESGMVKPRVIVCVPSRITEVESRTVSSAAMAAGARKVYLIEEPVAAALGAGIDIANPNGIMIVDIGGGTTDAAIISLSGIVSKRSIKVAGNRFDESIIRFMRSKHDLLIGPATAEKIKTTLATLDESDEATSIVKGRDAFSGLPRSITVSSAELRPAVAEVAEEILSMIQQVLESAPPELAGDIYGNGILLAGGGSLLKGLTETIRKFTGVPVAQVENPHECVAIGTGRAFQFMDTLQDGFSEAKAPIQ